MTQNDMCKVLPFCRSMFSAGCIWWMVFTPVFGQSTTQFGAYRIVYRQILTFSQAPDTSRGVLTANGARSVYVYGISSPSNEKTAAYVDGNGQTHQVIKTASAGDAVGKCVFKQFANGVMQSREKAVNQYFIVHDTLNQIKWKITGESKIMQSYPVFKATGEFRGRQYTAWFTRSIPLPDGPWKLAGLPGLILEAQDESGEVRFTAVDIQRSTREAVAITPPTGYPEIATFQEYRSQEKRLEDLDREKGKAYFQKADQVKKVSVTFKVNKLEN